jgi:glutathione peroxidase
MNYLPREDGHIIPILSPCNYLALRLTMRRILATLAAVGALLLSAGSAWADFDDDSGANKLFVADAALPVSAHEFRFETIGGEPLPLAQYAGKVVLVVNTASECSFAPQFEGLQILWERYRERGLVVLGVPSNDFGGQEPGSASEIKTYCRVSYGVDFPLTSKTRVKGADAHPFYVWARDQLGFLAKPRWNFHKYLLARDGRLDDWFSTMTEPTSARVIRAIKRLLDEPGGGGV